MKTNSSFTFGDDFFGSFASNSVGRFSEMASKALVAAAVAVAISISAFSLPTQAARRKAKPTVEAEAGDSMPNKLVVDTSGEENKMDKAVLEKSTTAASGKDVSSEAAQVFQSARNTATGSAAETSAGDAAAHSTAGMDVDAALALAKKEAAARLPENEIPVLTKINEERKDAGGGMTRIFVTLGVLLATFAAVSFGLKRWSARSTKSRSDNTKIRVLTQHHLGPKKTLAIIQVAGESILIGITDQNISMLKTLALIDDEVPLEVPNSFAGAMTDMEFDDDMDDSGSNFALRGLSEIRDVVSHRLGKGR